MINKFYLDKEKDIIVNLSKTSDEEITYVLETPNHNTGNLITNLANICGVKTIKNENDMKIITGKIPASINSDNEEVYIFRLGGIKIANIYENRIEIKAKIPAITKTLMSQTKNYKLPIEKTIVKTYILKKSKFRTDLHTHMNANLFPDCLIALGIVHQIRYPLYYIKKLNLKMNKEQEEKIYKQREEIEKQFIDSPLQGKYKIRKIDDNTFINFLIRAKKSTYANANIEKVSSSRNGSSDYNYEEIIDNKKYTYHDTYFGGVKFIGEEVVYCDKNKPIWGMNYYGITYDDTLGKEIIDNALRPALMKVGEDRDIIPVRGPIKFENNGYIYTFKTTGTIENFDAIEQIYKDNNLIYELHCSGGIIK